MTAPAAAISEQARTGTTLGNPLAGVEWGIYRGPLDGLYPAYEQARGESRRLLAKEALRPSVHWLGAWDSDQNCRR